MAKRGSLGGLAAASRHTGDPGLFNEGVMTLRFKPLILKSIGLRLAGLIASPVAFYEDLRMVNKLMHQKAQLRKQPGSQRVLSGITVPGT